MTRSEEKEVDAVSDIVPFGPWLLFLLPFIVYGRFILGDELANADVILAYRPAHAILADALRRGDIPLWTSTISGGFPIAFSEYGWFSPLVWIPLVIGGAQAGYYGAVALSTALAGVAMYGLARTWGATRVEATLAGLIFSQSLFVVGGAPLLNQAGAYWVLPALLWVVARTIDWHPLAPPLGGIVLALGILGGHPQVVLIAALPAMLWAAVALFREGEFARRMALLILLGACILGVGVSAVRVIPTMGVLESSVRQGGLPDAARALGSVTPLDFLLGLLAPWFSMSRWVSAHWAIYLGPLPVGLAIFAVSRYRKLIRDERSRTDPGSVARRARAMASTMEASAAQIAPRRVVGEAAPVVSQSVTALPRPIAPDSKTLPPFSPSMTARLPWLGAMAVIGIVIAFGKHGYVGAFVGGLPVLGFFRDPSRFLLWTVGAVAILAPMGLRLTPLVVGRAGSSTRRDPWSVRSLLGLRTGSSQQPVTGSAWWFGIAVALVLAVMTVSAVLARHDDTLRILAEERFQVGARVFEASASRGDYSPEFYRARFEATWRHVHDMFDVTSPGVTVPLLALVGAGWWWAWGRPRRDANLLAGLFIAAPLLLYGQVRLPGIAANDVVLAQESSFDAVARLALVGVGDVPSRHISWLPLATDYELRVRALAAGRMYTEVDTLSYQVWSHLVTPNLAMSFARDAGARDPRILRLASVDGYENLVTREQALVAAALGSERAPAGSSSSSSLTGLRQRRQSMASRWGVLASSGGGALLTASAMAPLEVPAGVIVEKALVSGAGDVPTIDMYRLIQPWPRTYGVTAWAVAGSADDAMGLELGIDLLAGPQAVVTRTGNAEIPKSPGAGGVVVPVRITREADGVVAVEVDTAAPTLVVLLDALTPGWTASIDGRKAPIVPTNVAFRGVFVPAGRHGIVFTYEPDGWGAARAVTAAALVLLAAWLLNVGTRPPHRPAWYEDASLGR